MKNLSDTDLKAGEVRLKKFKAAMLKSSFGYYSDAYIPVEETITVAEQGVYDPAIRKDGNNKQAIFKTRALFTLYPWEKQYPDS